MIVNEQKNRQERILDVAGQMMTAARTAPKGKGVDNLEIITVWGDDLRKLAGEMRRYSDESGMKFFLRDAGNIEQSECVVLIGTALGTFGLNCGFCGFPACADKSRYPDIPCAFNTNDLGIAVGSAVSIAADNRVDSRVMYSVAKAALNLGMLGESKVAFGILLSCTGKSPFFDRPTTK